MKIAQITSTIWPYRHGGRERHVYYLSQYLTKLGHDITIYTAGNNVRRESFEGINLCWLPSLVILLPYSETMLHVRVSPLLTKFLIKDEPDLIHLHDYGSFTLGTTFAVIAKKIPLVVTMHGPLGARSWPTASKKLRLMLNLYDHTFFRFTLSFTSRVIAVSNNICDGLLESRLIKNDKVAVIPNGINMHIVNFAKAERFRKKYNLHGKKIILCVGRIIKEKGYWRLAMIPPNLLRKWRGYVKIVLIGSTEGYLSELKKLFKKYNAEDVLLFVGRVSDMTLYDAYAAADVFVIPSDIEGLPIRLLEAMAFGKAIVAIKAGEMSRLIENGKDGILIDPSDINGLHKAIDYLLNNTKFCEYLGFNAREKVKRYDWRNIVRSIDDIYKQAFSSAYG